MKDYIRVLSQGDGNKGVLQYSTFEEVNIFHFISVEFEMIMIKASCLLMLENLPYGKPCKMLAALVIVGI